MTMFNEAKLTVANAGKNVEQKKLFSHCWWKNRMVQLICKTGWQFSKVNSFTSLYIMGSSFIHLIRTDSNEFFLIVE